MQIREDNGEVAIRIARVQMSGHVLPLDNIHEVELYSTIREHGA